MCNEVERTLFITFKLYSLYPNCFSLIFSKYIFNDFKKAFQPVLNIKMVYICFLICINKRISTVVKIKHNLLSYRKGMFFDVLKRCFKPFNFCLDNPKNINVSTELTGYNSNHIYKNLYIF